MAKSNSSIWVSLGLNTDQFKKGIKGAKGSMSSLKGGLNALSPVSLGVAGALAGIGLAVGNAVKTFKEFEKANSELEAVLTASKTEMSLLSEQAKILGATTSFTASEVTSLQTSLAKLGFNSSEIQNMTASTLAAAAALGSDLGEQATLTGATLKSFGLDSSEAARVNDVLAKSAASSALDFGKLSTALPIVGAVAKATGLSLERTTAILGTLTNNGLDASSSATALRNILIKLKEKGLTWNQAMEQINNSTDKTKTSFDLFGKTSTAAGVILAKQGTTLNQLTTSLNKAEGAAQSMANTMLDNLSGDVTKANSAWEGFVLDLEDGNGRIAVAMRSIVQSFTGMLETFKEDDIADSLGLSRGLFQELGATEQALVDLSASTGSLASKFASGKTSIAQFMTQTIALRKKQGELNRETETGNAKWLIYEDLINKLNKQATVLAERNSKLAKETKEVAEGTDDATVSTNELIKARGKLIKITKVKIPPPEPINPEDVPPVMVPIKPIIEIDEGVSDSMIDLGNDMSKELGLALEAGIGTAAMGVGNALGEALAGGDFDMGGVLIGAFSNLLSTFGQQMITLGIAQAALFESLKLGPLGAALAIGGGIALIAAASAIKSSMSEGATGFAAGGLVTGSVFANVGEGRGTTKSNPEVIAPLDKLQNMIAGSGGGMSGGEVVFRIQGQELVGILNRMQKVNKFS